MKKILFSLFALLCTMGAWAQLKVSDAPSNGQWAANTTWHIMYNASNQFLNSSYVDDAGNLLMNNTTASASDEALWCIVGTEEAGYKFYNKAKGADVVLGISGADQNARATFVSPTSGTHTISFDIVQSAKTDDTYWCMKEHGSENKYWNKRGNYLAYWNDAEAQKSDNASAFNITPIAEAFHSEAELAEVKSVLKVGVGYPKTNSTVYSDLNNLAINKKTKKQVAAMVNAYYASTDIQLPEEGKTYTLSFFDPTGAEHKIAADGTAGAATSGKFYCKVYTNVNEETRYAFVSENGQFFCSHGIQGYNTYKFDYNDFTINPMVSVTSNVDQSTKQDRFGYVYLIADHRHNSTGVGSVCLKWSEKTYDNSKGAHFENTDSRKYTTAIKMTEVEETASNTVLQAASTIPALVTGKKGIGSAIGQYTNWAYDSKSGSDYAGFEAAVNEAAKTKVVEGYTFSGLNLPQSGKFYRIKNSATTPAYLISGTQEKRVDFATDAAEKINSIFCYVDGKLLSYQNGMYLAKRPGENFMGYAQSVGGSTDITFAECGTVGKLNVIFNTNRYLYSNGTGSDAGSSDGDRYYRFTVEEVEWLPIPVNKEVGYATIYSPVELALSSNRFKAYTVSAVYDEFATLEEQTVVPANVGVVLELQQGAEIINDCVYLEIKATETAATSELCGTYADEYIDEDAYVLSMVDDEVGFYKALMNQQENTAFLNNGFKAYLPANGSNARALVFSFGTETAIEGVEGENGNVKTEIYDLAGRRVQGVQKGIYVVNGKKVVK